MNKELENDLSNIKCLIDKGKTSLAYDRLKKLQEKYNNDGNILFNIGKLLDMCKDKGNALDYYCEAENNGYKSVELFLLMAVAYQSLGMRNEAEKYFVKADKSDDEKEYRWTILSATALFYIECRKFLNAEKIEKRLLQEFPNNYQGYHIHILIGLSKGNYEDVLTYLKKVPEVFQTHPQFLIDYIQLYKSQGKDDELQNLFNNDNRFEKYVPQEVLKEKLKIISDDDEKKRIIVELAQVYNDSDAVVALIILNFIQADYKKSAEIANFVLEQEVVNQGIKFYLALYFQIYNFYFLSEKRPSEELKKWIEKAGNWCIKFAEEIDNSQDIVRNNMSKLFSEINEGL